MSSLDKAVSYNVRLWQVRTYQGAKKKTYTVRWVVEGRQFQQTFTSRKLADSFRSEMLTAANEGRAFDVARGLPASTVRRERQRTWYEHACAFVDMKWPRASSRHRRSIAESLATVTPALLATERGAPDPTLLRRTLYNWSFNPMSRESTDAPPEVQRALRWLSKSTLPLQAFEDSAVTRRALDAVALKLDGAPAAPTTIARKRAVLYGALRYAVELKLLPANPIDQVQWQTPKATESVDRRVVVNPTQARDLLAAVRSIDPTLEAFFGCLYFAALRPGEALHLREQDCILPEDGWGSLHLAGSTQRLSSTWSDAAEGREDRGLKHRSRADTRVVPAHPELVRLLRHHIDTFGADAKGHLFITRTRKTRQPVAAPYGRPLSNTRYARVWRQARKVALTPPQQQSPLAERPYDLRHAAVSLWLNSGVPATQVAEWAGHSVHVLLKVYAKCLYGQDHAARQRIAQALSQDARAASGP